MENNEKSDVWTLKVSVDAYWTVCFDEPVTKQKAIELFNMRAYDDVIDEDVLSVTTDED